MKLVFLLLFGTAVLTQAAPSSDDGFPLLVPGGGIGGIFKGPNKETIIQGPDGSVITAENEPGIIVQSEALKEPSKPIIVADIHEEPIANIIQDDKVDIPIIQNVATASVAPVEYQGHSFDIENSVAPSEESKLLRNNLILKQQPSLSDEELLEPTKIIYAQPRIKSEPLARMVIEETHQPALFEPQQSLQSPTFSISTASPPLASQRSLLAPKISLSTSAPKTISLSSTPTPPVLSSIFSPSFLSSTVAPRAYSSSSEVLSSTLAPKQLAFSSTVGSNNLIESDRIFLGRGDLRESIPVIEYASSNGFVNNARAQVFEEIKNKDSPNLNLVSSTAVPFTVQERYLYSTRLPPITAKFGVQQSPLVYKRSSLQRRQIYNPQYYTNMQASNIQKIPKFGRKNVRIDDKIDMGNEYRSHRDLYDRSSDTLQLPPSLRTQLAQYLPKFRNDYVRNDQRTVVIDGKMGDLADNEIPQQMFYAPSNMALSDGKLLSYVELSNGNLGISGRNLYQVPRRITEDRIEADLWNRYGRDTKNAKNR